MLALVLGSPVPRPHLVCWATMTRPWSVCRGMGRRRGVETGGVGWREREGRGAGRGRKYCPWRTQLALKMDGCQPSTCLECEGTKAPTAPNTDEFS